MLAVAVKEGGKNLNLDFSDINETSVLIHSGDEGNYDNSLDQTKHFIDDEVSTLTQKVQYSKSSKGRNVTTSGSDLEKILDMLAGMDKKFDERANLTEVNLKTSLRDTQGVIMQSINENTEKIKNFDNTVKDIIVDAQLVKARVTTVEEKVDKLEKFRQEIVNNSFQLAPISDFKLISFFMQYKIERDGYRNHVDTRLRNGHLKLKIKKEATNEFIYYPENSQNWEVDKNKLIDLLGCAFTIDNGYITNDNYILLIKIDAHLQDRKNLTLRALKNRHTFKNQFGLSLHVAPRFDLDTWIYKVIPQISFENDSSKRLIAGAGSTIRGFYQITLNDPTDENRQKFRAKYNRDGSDYEVGTKIYPGCPRSFLELEEQNFTYVNLVKSADYKNYFVWGGNVHKIPECCKVTQRVATENQASN